MNDGPKKVLVLGSGGLKIGQAVALGITGGVLSLVGYVPEVAQTAESMFGIRLLLGPIPALIFILSLVMLYFYPINEQRYNEILDDIKKMEAKNAQFNARNTRDKGSFWYIKSP